MPVRQTLKKDFLELEAHIAAGSQDAEDYLELGRHYFDKGNFTAILNLFEKALELSLNTLDKSTILLEMGRARETLGYSAKAIDNYKESLDILKKERDSALVEELKAMCHYNLSVNLETHHDAMSHAELALAGFQRLIDRYPRYRADKGSLYSHMGELYMMLGREEEALISYRLALEYSNDNDGHVWSLNGIATVYKRMGNLSEAENQYRQALADAQNKSLFSKNYYDLGEVLEMKGQDGNALNAFLKALEYRDDDLVLRHSQEYLIDILWSIGSLSFRRENLEEVLNFLGRVALLIDEGHRLYCNTHILLGHSFVERGDFEQAAVHYNKALFSPVATAEEIEVANDSLKDIETEHNA